MLECLRINAYFGTPSRGLFLVCGGEKCIKTQVFLQHIYIQHLPHVGMKKIEKTSWDSSPLCKDANFHPHQTHAENQLPHSHKPHLTPCSPHPDIPFTKLIPLM
jgi:hypothetical protein